MKTNHPMALLAVCGVLALSAGCGKTESTPPLTTTTAPTAAKPADQAAAEAQKAAETQRAADAERTAQAAQAVEAQKKQAEAKAAETAKAVATQQQAAAERLAAEKAAAEKALSDKLALEAAAKAKTQAQIQGLIDTAKSLTGENKYAEALKVIAELSKLKLSTDQQTLVDGLKQAAEKQAAQAVADRAVSSASKALGDALGGKK